MYLHSNKRLKRPTKLRKPRKCMTMQWRFVQIFGTAVHGAASLSVLSVFPVMAALSYIVITTYWENWDSPLYALRGELKNAVEEYNFFSTHLVRKTYQIEFIKCKSSLCQHCKSRPVRPLNCMAYIESHRNCMPTPSKSASKPDHYVTFLDTLTAKPRGPHRITEFLPSDQKPRQSCRLCRYIPSTPTDE